MKPAMSPAVSTVPALPSLLGQRAEMVLAGGLFGLVGILLIPMPGPILDMLLALNLAMTVLLLLITLGAKQPLDFSVFPSVLLLSTLFRLTLNVSTTRSILLHGEAGAIVRAFGDYVVQGNLLVGLVVFGIPRGHPVRGRHERRGPHLRSCSTLHPGCNAGQADGDRC